MAQYLILIYESPELYQQAGPGVFGEIMAEHQAYWAKVEELGGKMLGGEALQPPSTATSIRAAGAEVTDGPFAETKEALGGYYLIEANDLDQAIAIGRACPARFGGVEVRPIMTFEGREERADAGA